MQITRWGPGSFVLACSLAGLLLASAIALAMPVHYVSREMITVDPANQVSLRALDHPAVRQLSTGIAARFATNTHSRESRPVR